MNNKTKKIILIIAFILIALIICVVLMELFFKVGGVLVKEQSRYVATSHTLTCSRCGYQKNEEHMLIHVTGGSYCSLCGYDTRVGGEITLKDPDKLN